MAARRPATLRTTTHSRVFTYPTHVKEVKNKDKPPKQMAQKTAPEPLKPKGGKQKIDKAPKPVKCKKTNAWCK